MDVALFVSHVAFSPQEKRLLVQQNLGDLAGETGSRMSSQSLLLYEVIEGRPRLVDEKRFPEETRFLGVGWDEGQRAFYYISEDERGVTIVWANRNGSVHLPIALFTDVYDYPFVETYLSDTLWRYERVPFALSDDGMLAFALHQSLFVLDCGRE